MKKTFFSSEGLWKNMKNFPERRNFLKKIRKKNWNNYVKAGRIPGCDFGTPWKVFSTFSDVFGKFIQIWPKFLHGFRESVPEIRLKKSGF